MKIFSWMKNKLHGKDNTIKPEPEPEPALNHMLHQTSKEGEFYSSSSTLLAIGTLGNNLRDSDNANIQENLPSGDDHLENTALNELEEVDQEFMRLLLDEQFSLNSNLPENEEITIESIIDASEKENALIHRTITTAHRRGEGVPSHNKKNGMYKKSISFLLKKAFLCGSGGFVPSPILSAKLKDPFPDPNLDNSRMEKILRAMLLKKKYPQRQRYLDMLGTDNDEEQEETTHGKKKYSK